MDEYSKLKTDLGISSRSLVHHWDKAGAPGQIPGYANHVNATSRAAPEGAVFSPAAKQSSIRTIRFICCTRVAVFGAASRPNGAVRRSDKPPRHKVGGWLGCCVSLANREQAELVN